jgi:hypothetical protein
LWNVVPAGNRAKASPIDDVPVSAMIVSPGDKNFSRRG